MTFPLHGAGASARSSPGSSAFRRRSAAATRSNTSSSRASRRSASPRLERCRTTCRRAEPSRSHAAALSAEHAAARGAASEHVSRASELGLMGFSVLIAVAGILLARKFYVDQPGDFRAAGGAVRRRAPRCCRTSTTSTSCTTRRSSRARCRGPRPVDVRSQRRRRRRERHRLADADQLLVLGPDRSHASSTALVNLVGWIVQESSYGFRRLQTGLVQNYALLMLFGIFAFVSMYLFVR